LSATVGAVVPALDIFVDRIESPDELEIVGEGRLRIGRAKIRGVGEVSWEDRNEETLLLLAA
jgi:hypothetical protein